MSDAIVLRGVTKTFTVPHVPYATIRERFSHAMALRTRTKLTVLRDINLDVARGEFLGVIGRNGSGKSTLLKIIAGIYATDFGTVYVADRLSPFIGLGVGFHPDLTVRENVFLCGTVFGLTRALLKQQYSAIIDFAELADFTEMKMKQLSTGMQMRAAFAIAIEVNSPILLMDEVLAVGDRSFQAKCLQRLQQYKHDGRTVVFVSHDLNHMTALPDRVAYLDRGELKMIGEPSSVVALYCDDTAALPAPAYAA